jgi:hypothetical protein
MTVANEIPTSNQIAVDQRRVQTARLPPAPCAKGVDVSFLEVFDVRGIPMGIPTLRDVLPSGTSRSSAFDEGLPLKKIRTRCRIMRER